MARSEDSMNWNDFSGQAAASNPLTQTVLIRSDRRAPVGSFIGVIDVCKKLGLNYTEATEDE